MLKNFFRHADAAAFTPAMAPQTSATAAVTDVRSVRAEDDQFLYKERINPVETQL
jgi:hypothetical protein